VNNLHLYFNLTHFEKYMDAKRARATKNSALEPIIIAPNNLKIDQSLLKKVVQGLLGNPVPQTFKPAGQQPQPPKAPTAAPGTPAEQPAQPRSSKPAPEAPKHSGGQETPQKPAQETKNEDVQKMMRMLLKSAQQLMVLTATLKSVEKFAPTIKKEIAEVAQKRSLGAPTWKFASNLLQFAPLRQVEAVNDAVGRWKKQRISERVLVNELVEVYLSLMYAPPPTEEQVLTEYPASIMLQAIRENLSKEKYERFKKLIVKQIVNHLEDNETLALIQREFMEESQRQMADLQKRRRDEAKKPESKQKPSSQPPEERVLGLPEEEADLLDAALAGLLPDPDA
jgi:hypothetical protein